MQRMIKKLRITDLDQIIDYVMNNAIVGIRIVRGAFLRVRAYIRMA
jgi:hypothetical protein